MSPIFCVVFALLALCIGLFEYFRSPAPREPIFWPLLGILILLICQSPVFH